MVCPQCIAVVRKCVVTVAMQGRRKHFRIGQAIKFALLTNFLSTTITCKATLCLADASWFLKLMVASFQFLKPLLLKAKLSLL